MLFCFSSRIVIQRSVANFAIALYVVPRYNGTRLYYYRGISCNNGSHELILLNQRHKNRKVFFPICGSTCPSPNVIFKLKLSGRIKYDVS